MSDQAAIKQDERMLAGLAHGSVLLGLFTNGVGGIGTALVIWLTQKEKSAYVKAQAVQALIYQVVTLIVTMLAWCCWGGLWMALLLPPILANPDAYDKSPPASMWVGLVLMVVPFGIWGLTMLYGLWGAARCLGGHNFKYIGIGNWLERQRP
ncbi:MAG: DUF4870 domain-containing protein [Anaerolineales bacterium]|nr:MAG: DUF4870 domain-containing protein [Anaerolineales bacterium]